MKGRTILSFFCIFLISCIQVACTQKSEWVETEAIVINVTKLEDNSFIYTIQYNAPESTAINKEGKEIKGPIEQHTTTSEEPIDQQKLRIRYRRDEPIIFELIDEIKFIKS